MAYLSEIDQRYAHRLVHEPARVTEFGEIFTPPKFVKSLLDLLDAKVWSDPTVVFVEPACGDGAFVIPVLERRFAGLTNRKRDRHAVVAIAVSTVWGIDLQANNVAECRANVLRAVLAHLYDEIIIEHVARDVVFIAAIAAAIEHQIRVGNGLNFHRAEKTFLMLSPDDQRRASEKPLTQLNRLLAGDSKWSNPTTWLSSVFRAASVIV